MEFELDLYVDPGNNCLFPEQFSLASQGRQRRRDPCPTTASPGDGTTDGGVALASPGPPPPPPPPSNIAVTAQDPSESEPPMSPDDSNPSHPDAAKLRIIDEIVESLAKFLRSRLAQLGVSSGGKANDYGGTAAGGQSVGCTSGSTKTRRQMGPGGQDDEHSGEIDGDDDEDEGKDRERRPCGDEASSEEDDNQKPKLACPYFKFDPAKYEQYSGCSGSGWHTVHRLKCVTTTLPHVEI
jgi:hypothetical protein